MKIVYLSTNITGSGGVARVTADKTNYFIEKWGHEVFVISTNDLRDEPFFKFNSKIKFHFIATKMHGLSSLWRLYKQINDLLTSINPEIIVINDNGIKAYFAPFLIRAKIPLFLEVHGAVKFSFYKTHSRLKSMLISKYIDFSAAYFERVILLNSESKSEWKTAKLTVIPNFTALDSTEEMTIEQNRIIAIGRISTQKGYDRMLAIWKKIAEYYPEWSLHIYGKVEDELLYDQLLRVQVSNVYFHGESVDVLSELKKSKFFIHTAYFEGMPMVLLEAMAHGVTGVAFDVPFGIKEIITHEYNGLVVYDNNEDEFIRQLKRLINDIDLRNQLRSNTKKSIKSFREEMVMPLWEQLFQEYQGR